MRMGKIIFGINLDLGKSNIYNLFLQTSYQIENNERCLTQHIDLLYNYFFKQLPTEEEPIL
jgi:hypothetical protein